MGYYLELAKKAAAAVAAGELLLDPIATPKTSHPPEPTAVPTMQCDKSDKSDKSPAAAHDTPSAGLQFVSRYVTRPEDLVHLAGRLVGSPIVGIDLETHGLDPHRDAVRLITLAVAESDPVTGAPQTVAYIVDTQACPQWAAAFQPIFSDPTTPKVFHNAKFDLRFILAASSPGLGIAGVFDTMLSAQLLDGGQHLHEKGYFKLATVVERELGQVLDKSLQTSDWAADTLSEAQLNYAAKDAAVLLRLHRVLASKLAVAHLSDAAALEFTALPALAWLELSGAPFDQQRWMDLSDQAVDRKLRIADEIGALLTQDLGENGLHNHQINLDSTKQIKDTLNAMGIPVENTREETLAAAADRHPIVLKLLAYREASKLAGTYGIEFVQHVHDRTGRIHADYHQIGTVTGRMSCSSPNLQQVPRDPAYRACFRPGTGRVLVKADLSLIELCVAADLSRDDRMIQAITDGQDLHRLTAAALFGKQPEAVTLDERAFGKAVNFGTLFGQGRAGLITLAAQHGLTLNDGQAADFQRRFARAWPQLAGWQKPQMRSTTPEVHTASGRVRYLDPGAFGTVRANTPVQGTAADGFKAALARLWETRDLHPSAVPVLAVHDELVVEAPEDDAEAVAVWVTGCLQEGMSRYLKRVPTRVEVTIAPTWAGGG